jgi:hypothetical protein
MPVGIIIYLIQTITYIYTFLKNPGLPKINSEEDMLKTNLKSKRGIRFCAQCNVFLNMDEGVKHCKDCDVCIEGFDHHCPWTSKCVGKGNIIAFNLFVMTTGIYLAYLIFAFAVSS